MVGKMPIASLPGTTALAIKPATNPMSRIHTKPNFPLFQLGLDRVNHTASKRVDGGMVLGTQDRRS